MTVDNNTGKNKEFYDLGKKMFDRIKPLNERSQTKPSRKRPIEADYASQVAYTRALEIYCDTLAQPVQEPLTDKQILADETLRYYFGQNGGAGPVSKQGRKVVDAIEAAHNIKEKNND